MGPFTQTPPAEDIPYLLDLKQRTVFCLLAIRCRDQIDMELYWGQL